MAESWQEVKRQLEQKTKEIALNCPDEIKRFHYGIITHSDAGKHSFDQYFGHWVHLYGYYFVTAEPILPNLLRMTQEPLFGLEQVKELVRWFTPLGNNMYYAGQTTVAEYGTKVHEALDTVKSKEELYELLQAWTAFFSRMYWWLHWYFPWGIGPSLCHRRSAEDIQEMVRLSQTG